MNKNATSLKQNPKETANIFSQIFLWWMLDLFLKGAKTDLKEADIYEPLKEDDSKKVTDHLEQYWNRELERLQKLEYTVGKDGQKVPLKENARPKLYKALFHAFWLPYVIIGIYIFIQACVLRILIPILQGWIISYFVKEPNSTNKLGKNETMIYIACLVICTFGSALLLNHTLIMSQQIGMRLRVACSSLIYRKILRLSQISLTQTGAGQIVNLLSNDVNRFDLLTVFLNYIWIMPIQIIIVGYIMWQKVGISIFVGIGLLLIISLPIQGTFSLLSHNIRAKIAPLTDRRVQLMNELIAGIQVIKMYAWEKPFSKIVSVTRALEIKKIKFSSYVRAAYLAIIVFTERLLLYFTLIMFVLSGNYLTADVTYTLATFYNLLQLTAALFFPQALIILGETMVSMSRLEDVLLMDEVNMDCFKGTSHLQSKNDKLNKATATSDQVDVYNNRTSDQESHSNRPICVELYRVSANWISGQLPPTLCNVSTIINPGKLSALVGPVGSGKSSMLYLLLKELNPGAGSVIFTHTSSKKVSYGKIVNDYHRDNSNLRISYASQEPWLFGGTVKDNILFGQSFDRVRYAEVTKVCALMKDFKQLPQGDMTIVGERGVSLSGGQRARINLARAVYRQADLYLLDDPLSAVDTHVAKHLYTKCITEYLHGKTRILVTHQLQFLKLADQIIVLDRGFIKMQGNYNELVKSNKDFNEMMDDLATSHETQKKEENARRLSEISSRISIFKRPSQMSLASTILPSEIDDSDYTKNEPAGETMIHGMLSGKVYAEYLHHGGNYFILFVLLLFFIISQIATTGNDYWVSYWTNLEDFRHSENITDANQVNKKYMKMYNDSFLKSIFTLNSDGLLNSIDAIYIYTFCIITCTVTILFRSFLFMKVCMNSSINLHNTMFSNLLQARMSFFHTNPSGQILNRFSKDIGTIDELLPKIMLEALQMISVLLAILIIVAILNYWMIIPIIILSILFYLITKFYLKTAQSVKRLEGITKSPLFSHINATLNGLPTIRSSGANIEKMMQNKFDTLQNTHSGAWYQVLACGTIFAIVLDTITSLFLACVCYSFILIDENGGTSGGDVGLAISQSLILTSGLQHGIKQVAETFSLMTAVERILQYTNLPTESAVTSNDSTPPPTWPSQGQLTFKGVNMKYDKNGPFVLKNLNVSIEPGWKIGVVGRTGAGKSSLISALFRLFDEELKGEIKIDGWETSKVGLQELRSKISIIPQEPVLFSESLRYNLDPFNQYDDARLWEVLRLVELSEVGLDHNVLHGGHNFSVGQRQLICLARAILRNNRLLVLDEATANIDSHTDALIQETIRKNFQACTVITIAHRLNTIIDSNRIIVMDNGYIVEFGSPYELLRGKPDGYFKQMVEKTGNQMAQNLFEQARKAHQENENNQNVDLSSSGNIITDQTKL
ncbi:ATP-binding cassette sub-family C member 4 [Anoplolepis gracilipes]|uniref:ATP-binding cassette sub-family C member 4 n=1 Tax=Anoplolepis gracilipes TaxID=354296 RepID=UPI003BA02A55